MFPIRQRPSAPVGVPGIALGIPCVHCIHNGLGRVFFLWAWILPAFSDPRRWHAEHCFVPQCELTLFGWRHSSPWPLPQDLPWICGLSVCRDSGHSQARVFIPTLLPDLSRGGDQGCLSPDTLTRRWPLPPWDQAFPGHSLMVSLLPCVHGCSLVTKGSVDRHRVLFANMAGRARTGPWERPFALSFHTYLRFLLSHSFPILCF